MSKRTLTLAMLAILLATAIGSVALAESADDFSGFYDAALFGTIDPDINLILTPDGHGRLINSTDSVNFDYSVENGIPVVPDPELTLSPSDNGLSARIATGDVDITLEFTRRDDVRDDRGFIGSWALCGMEGNGQIFSRDMLAVFGLSIDMKVYASGAIDWHAITDAEVWLAQGWGIDEQGPYLKNGSAIIPVNVDGDNAELEMNGAIFRFERVG